MMLCYLISDDSLKEGAPIPPEPPLGSWRPEQKVNFFFHTKANVP